MSQVDSALPRAGVLAEAVDSEPADVTEPADVAEPADEPDEIRYPFVADSFLRTKMKDLMLRYGVAFGEAWRADPERLRLKAVELLDRYRMVRRVDGGVLLLPLAGRYRNVVAKVTRRKPAAATLFDTGGAL